MRKHSKLFDVVCVIIGRKKHIEKSKVKKDKAWLRLLPVEASAISV